MTNVKFRQAKFKDIENIIKLCNEVFEENTDLHSAKTIFLNNQDDTNQIYLIGYIDNKIIAHTKISIIPTIFDKTSTYAILNHVCVKKEYRHQKIATQMLQECEKICHSKGCTSLKLYSSNFRTAAHSLYQSFGFENQNLTFFSKIIN